MKPLIHKSLEDGRWFTFTIYEQLGNVGSEFERAARAFERGDNERFERAFERMLELLDLTNRRSEMASRDASQRAASIARRSVRYFSRRRSLWHLDRNRKEVLPILCDRGQGEPLRNRLPHFVAEGETAY